MNPEAVMAKLDEILKAVNPNTPPKVYDCVGRWHMMGLGNVLFASGGNDKTLQEMVKLLNAEQFPELLKACLEHRKSDPQWLTPLLFCSAAYGGMGDLEHARAAFSEFESRTGPAYDAEQPCRDLRSQLQRGLSRPH